MKYTEIHFISAAVANDQVALCFGVIDSSLQFSLFCPFWGFSRKIFPGILYFRESWMMEGCPSTNGLLWNFNIRN
jgi:hypothetical protein